MILDPYNSNPIIDIPVFGPIALIALVIGLVF
jgi:hypothetical protein